MTEFERTLSEIIDFWQRDNGSVLKTQSKLKSDAKSLLELAKQELEKQQAPCKVPTEVNKIAKELIKYLPYCDDISKDTKERWISWLKTQDDQNPADTKPHFPDGNIPYDRGFEEAQEYLSIRGFDIPWNDGDVFVDVRYITQTIANVLTWADEHPRKGLWDAEKVVEWLKKNCTYTHPRKGTEECFINLFALKDAMEE